VLSAINKSKPEVVFAPHVETSAGMILPDEYITAVAEAVHAYGGMFVLDCIASGAVWVDMKAIGVDVLVSAPQKGWTATPCAGLVVLSEHACKVLEKTTSNSFSLDLKKWGAIMHAYLDGKHAYHSTMPTDSLIELRDVMQEMHAAQGMQIAAGVPLQIGESDDYQSFRIGLFGLDKLNDVDAAVQRFETVLNKVVG